MNKQAIFDATTAMRLQTADWLDTLTPEQLDTRSLCTDWRVRDVAGHLTQALTISVPGMFLEVAKAGLSFDRANVVLGRRLGQQDPASLIRRYAHRALDLPFVGAHGQLTDLQVHNADMRIPLGSEWTPEPEWSAESLRFLEGGATGFASKKRIAGLRVVATDAEVTWGSGDLLRGRAYDLVVALCGRRPALERLHGPGTDVLRERLTA